MSSNDLNEKPEPPQELQSRLADALISSSKKTRSSGSLLSTFASQMEVIDFEQLNKFNLSCPRDGCGSTILLKGVAKWDVKETVDPIDLDSHSIPAALPPLEHSSQSSWWHISGSPMAFENISFTKSVSDTNEGGAPKKLLACAECNLGPLGMTIGTDYWLLANRVAYKP